MNCYTHNSEMALKYKLENPYVHNTQFKVSKHCDNYLYRSLLYNVNNIVLRLEFSMDT